MMKRLADAMERTYLKTSITKQVIWIRKNKLKHETNSCIMAKQVDKKSVGVKDRLSSIKKNKLTYTKTINFP